MPCIARPYSHRDLKISSKWGSVLMFGWCQKSPKTAANEDNNASRWTQGLRLELQDPPTLCWGKCMYRMSVHLPRTLRTRWTVVPIGVSGIVFSSVHYCSWRLLAPPGNQTVLGISGTLGSLYEDFEDHLSSRHFGLQMIELSLCVRCRPNISNKQGKQKRYYQ